MPTELAPCPILTTMALEAVASCPIYCLLAHSLFQNGPRNDTDSFACDWLDRGLYQVSSGGLSHVLGGQAARIVRDCDMTLVNSVFFHLKDALAAILISQFHDHIFCFSEPHSMR